MVFRDTAARKFCVVAAGLIAATATSGCASPEPRDVQIALAAPREDALGIALNDSELRDPALRPLERLVAGEDNVRLTRTEADSLFERLRSLHVQQHGTTAPPRSVISYGQEKWEIVTMSVELTGRR